MREIKFRRPFYDNTTNKFSYFSYWGVNINRAVFTSPASPNFAYSKADEQYTGLKDKNGVEIWEGDVIQWMDSITNRKIEFRNGSFYSITPNVMRHLSDLDPEFDLEVIGNIHANPELLNRPL